MKKIENVKIEVTKVEELLAKLPFKTSSYYIKKHKDGFATAVATLEGKKTKNDEDENVKHNTKHLQSILDAFASVYGVSNVTYRWMIATQTDADNIPHVRLQVFTNANEGGVKVML